MTTGSVSRNVAKNPFSGHQVSPCMQKTWSGTNDPTHSLEQDYTMSMCNTNFTQCAQRNTLYPYSPPVYYATRGLPDFTRVQALASTFNGNTDIKALSRVVDAIKGHGFNAASAFADIERTADLLVKATSRAIDAWRALKRATPAEFIRLVRDVVTGAPEYLLRGEKDLVRAFKGRDIAEIWLAAQYGWKPLIKDVEEAFSAFSAFRQGLASNGILYKGSAKGAPFKISLGPGGLGKPVATCTEKASYRVRLKETLTTAQSLGIVPLGFFTVAWERVAYSFVIDWFIPIGQTIELYAFFGSMQYSMARTRFKLYSYSESNLQASETNDPTWSKGSCNGTAVSIRREINLSLAGLVRPQFKPLRAALTTTHLLNAAALIYTKVSPKRDIRREQRSNAQAWASALT